MPGVSEPPRILENDPRASLVLTRQLSELTKMAQRLTFLSSDGTVAGGRRCLNIDAVWVAYVSNAVANTEDTVAHNLGRTPAGAWVGTPDKAAVIYTGPTAWTATNIFLRASVATVTVNILVF